nr:putative transposase En/Spm [Ipomoea batatas]
MSQRKRNRGKGKTVTGSHSQTDISQPPSLHALIDDPEEGSTHVMETPRNEVHRMLEDTDSERTPSSSRPTEHTTEGPSEHTSYAASESIDEATLGGGGEGMATESPPSTIPADRFTTFIRTVGGTAFEPHKAHRHIILCIQRMFTEPIRSFKYAPQHLKDVWFNEFKKKGAKLLSDHLREAREGFAKNRAKPDWISDDVMAGLVRIWGSDEFKKLSEKNKRNKNSDCDGLGASLHSCGSIPMTEHHRRLKEKLGEDPSHAALYEHTHKRKNGNGAYVCRKAQKVVDVANDLLQSQPDASNAQLWLEAIGGVKRGGYVYGFGSDTQHYFPEASRGSNSKSAESSSNASLLAEIQQMREENKMFREEVVKMSAILTQLSPNSEWLASLNINNSTSTNDETQAPNDED